MKKYLKAAPEHQQIKKINTVKNKIDGVEIHLNNYLNDLYLIIKS